MPDHPATRPEKRPLGFPVDPAALAVFCYPWDRHVYTRPVLLPSGDVATSNGWLALKASRFALPAPAEASPAFLARWDHGPKWGPRGIWADDQLDWRPLDDVLGTLFRFGARPAWEKGGLAWHLRREPAIRVGTGAVVPLPLLQLAARLPRAEVLATTRQDDHVRVRFNGGKLVLANHSLALMGREAVAVFTNPALFRK